MAAQSCEFRVSSTVLLQDLWDSGDSAVPEGQHALEKVARYAQCLASPSRCIHVCSAYVRRSEACSRWLLSPTSRPSTRLCLVSALGWLRPCLGFDPRMLRMCMYVYTCVCMWGGGGLAGCVPALTLIYGCWVCACMYVCVHVCGALGWLRPCLDIDLRMLCMCVCTCMWFLLNRALTMICGC